MAKGYKTGGRVKGKPNKVQAEVAERLTVLDCDPIAGMVAIAKQAMVEGELVIAGNMFKELAQYVAPKRKSIEMTSHVTYKEELAEMSEEELNRRLAELETNE
tara:strand:+ start:147 stop:455 length:309 start_codon:yes stop_codon:yes gene_type:complete